MQSKLSLSIPVQEGGGVTLREIAQTPTVYPPPGQNPYNVATPETPVHESVFRASKILEKVKELLEQGTPVNVVLELIREMES